MLTWSIAAQQQADPRQQPGAAITLFAPEQHDLYDGHFVLSANRIYMAGGLNDPLGRLGAIFSPDGRWVAYTIREAAATSDAVYAQPFPATGEKVQVSTNAENGHHPVWSSDGKELYYNPAPGTRLAAMKVRAWQGLALGPAPPPVKAFSAAAGTAERTFDVARDGKRFLGLISPSAASTSAAGPPRPELRVVLIGSTS